MPVVNRKVIGRSRSHLAAPTRCASIRKRPLPSQSHSEVRRKTEIAWQKFGIAIGSPP